MYIKYIDSNSTIFFRSQ